MPVHAGVIDSSPSPPRRPGEGDIKVHTDAVINIVGTTVALGGNTDADGTLNTVRPETSPPVFLTERSIRLESWFEFSDLRTGP